MSLRIFAAVLVLAVPGLLVPMACGGAPVAPPVSSEPPPPPLVTSASAEPAPSASASASCGDKELRDVHGNCIAAACPPGQVLGSDGNCKAPAPCLDGEEMMGACICPRGKSVDETGHCVFARCPEGTGGTVFRNETTGECMECRRGTVPCGDHCCPGAARAPH
jgi:hypothetical protein